ncbi:MAG: Uma2 family endonuclease [Chloroflexota bacterium]
MALNHPITTVTEFEAFIQRPENSEKVFEFISGEIVEVPTNHTASKVAARILLLIGMYLLKNDIGHLSGADHGFDVIADERYAPDVGYISYETMPQSSSEWFTPHPPELAVEVVSADHADENKKLSIKVSNYLAAVTVVWVVRHIERHIEVHAPGQPVNILRSGDTLGGAEVLPGLSINVDDIFAVIKE